MARVKGSQLADVIVAVRDLRDKAGLVVPEHLQRYLDEETVLYSNWYSESDFRDLILLLGRALQLKVEGNVWRMLGKQGAVRDVAGVYAAWVRGGDPERTLQKLGQGWSAVRDSGRVTVAGLGPGQAELTLKAYPVMCPELAELNAGYIEEMLKASGAKDAGVRVLEVLESGCRWKVSWRG